MQETTYSRWLISDMYYPSESIEGPIKSHEAICVLNTNDQDAGLTITLYFEDREPMQLAPQRCPARRNVHIRMDEARTADGSGVPMDTPYAAVVESKIGRAHV